MTAGSFIISIVSVKNLGSFIALEAASNPEVAHGDQD